MGGEGEGSGVKGGGKWGLGTPLSTPSFQCWPYLSPLLDSSDGLLDLIAFLIE